MTHAEIAELRRQADELESRTCTGLSASWCPVHGDCSCPQELGSGLDQLDDPGCPLHSLQSSHGSLAARSPSRTERGQDD